MWNVIETQKCTRSAGTHNEEIYSVYRLQPFYPAANFASLRIPGLS